MRITPDAYHPQMRITPGCASPQDAHHPRMCITPRMRITKLALPPPPIRATWSSFFPTSKTTYSAYDRKSTDDDDDGWNDNNDGDDYNIDEIDDKNDQKHTNIMIFE